MLGCQRALTLRSQICSSAISALCNAPVAVQNSGSAVLGAQPRPMSNTRHLASTVTICSNLTAAHQYGKQTLYNAAGRRKERDHDLEAICLWLTRQPRRTRRFKCDFTPPFRPAYSNAPAASHRALASSDSVSQAQSQRLASREPLGVTVSARNLQTPPQPAQFVSSSLARTAMCRYLACIGGQTGVCCFYRAS